PGTLGRRRAAAKPVGRSPARVAHVLVTRRLVGRWERRRRSGRAARGPPVVDRLARTPAREREAVDGGWLEPDPPLLVPAVIPEGAARDQGMKLPGLHLQPAGGFPEREQVFLLSCHS